MCVIMFDKYLSYKTFKDKALTRLKAQQDKENAPITVRDLVVTPVKSSYRYGEVGDHLNNYQEDTVVRLLDHIENMVMVANLYHRKTNYQTDDSGFQLKEGHSNHITRLSTYEFSLYSKEPLNEDDFLNLIASIEAIAATFHDNVHLLLSSVALIDKKGKLFNTALYVECGKNGKITPITKAMPSEDDISYKIAYSQKKPQNASKFSPFVGQEKGGSISNQSLFEIQASGGAKCLLGIDICLDHTYALSLSLLEQRLKRDEIDSSFLPLQADHILTSNTIESITTSQFTKSILHIDPIPKHTLEEALRPKEKKIKLDQQELNSIPFKDYPQMRLTVLPNKGLRVNNPPFGPSYVITVNKERKLGSYLPAIEEQVKKINKLVLNKQVINLMKNSGDNLSHTEDSLLQAMQNLQKQLLTLCKPTLLEAFVKGRTYQFKREVLEMLEANQAVIDKFKMGDGDLILQAQVIIKDLKHRLSWIDHNMNPQFLVKMNSPIHAMQQKIDEIQQRIFGEKITTLEAPPKNSL